MLQLFSKSEVSERFVGSCWERIVFSEFEAALSSRSRPFPCVFGVSGLAKDELRFAFLDPLTADSLAPILEEYLKSARDIGRLTSLVVFARPGPVQNIEDYRRRFWGLLDGLERIDGNARPAEVPEQLDTDLWEFCFAGEPIFVVCNTPAHVLRQSRRSTSFMITFQPRWVFEGITDTKNPATLKMLDSVRERLASYDAIDPAPYLGKYGEADNREYQQYFIDDSNEKPKCPFSALGAEKTQPAAAKGKVA